jgi:hypothetical protein
LIKAVKFSKPARLTARKRRICRSASLGFGQKTFRRMVKLYQPHIAPPEILVSGFVFFEKHFYAKKRKESK